MAPFAVSSLLGVAVPEGAAVLLPLALLLPVPRDLITFHSWTFSSAAMISSSETVPEGSMLSRILLFKTNVSCGIAMRLAQSFSRGSVDRSTPSIVIEPDSSSIRRSIESNSVDFPLNDRFQYFEMLYLGIIKLPSSSTTNSYFLARRDLHRGAFKSDRFRTAKS
jgi:hypothetical protein